MPLKRTLSSAMLYFGIVFLLAGCGGSEPTEQQNVAKIQHETHAIQAAITAKAKQSETPKPDPPPRSKPKPQPQLTLDLAGWRKLQSSLIPTVVLAGGAEAYLRDMREVEEHEVPGSACSTARECLLAIRSTLVQSVVETRGVLGHLQERTLGECAAAMQNASRLLKRWQRVIEATLPQAMASEYLWANSAHELDALEEPEGHLGDGLAFCDPNGTGEIEAQE